MARKRTRNYRAERSEEFVDEEGKGEEDEAVADEEEDEDEDAAEEEEEEAAAEEEEAEPSDDEDDEEDEPKPKKAKKVAKPKKPTVRRARAVKVVRKRAIWVILDNSSKPVEKFPYNQKAEAEKFLEEKNTEKKGFYIQMIKEEMDEK